MMPSGHKAFLGKSPRTSFYPLLNVSCVHSGYVSREVTLTSNLTTVHNVSDVDLLLMHSQRFAAEYVKIL